MSDRRLSTSKIAVFVILVGVVAGLGGGLFMIGGGTTANACVAEPGAMQHFQATEGRPAAPDTVFKDGAGKDRRLADHMGRGVVLNFWATWCAPCVREMPQLDRLKALIAGNGVDVLTVSEDRKGVPVVKKFYETNNLHDLEILVDPGGKLLRALKVRGLPTTVLFGADGREEGRVAGIAEWDSPEAVKFLRDCLGS
ncbi:MAG: TlpA disulfide reductase family protein [Magnetovibrio sp.]|nr:TlpA disulfide reductase family protein [Magnetovibrio sp.]